MAKPTRYENQIIEITAGLNSLVGLNEQLEGLNDIGYRVAHTLTRDDGGNYRVYLVMERESNRNDFLPAELPQDVDLPVE